VRIYSISLLAIALTLPACKPKESEIPASAPSKEAPNSSGAPAQIPAKTASTPEGYNPVFEAWKAQSVKEFPDLGVAGSRMNTLFVARAKQLQTQGAADLQNPAWPYLLAVQVNKELQAQTTPPTTPPTTARESNAAQPVKSAIETAGSQKISGIISTVERSVGGGPLELTIVLDKTITCKLDIRRSLDWSFGEFEIENQGDSAVMLQKVGAKRYVVKKWSAGQKIMVQGKPTQTPSGKMMLKDCIILDGVL
jgi:hypothetical protein